MSTQSLFLIIVVFVSISHSRGAFEQVFPVHALYFPNSKFSITPKRATWKVSQELCKQRHSRLGHFTSPQEYSDMLRFIKASGVHSSKRFWTGIHYLNHKAYFGIYTGEAAKFLKWSIEEPKLLASGERRECVMLWNPAIERNEQNEWNFTMSTENCDEEMFSICMSHC